MVIQIQPNLVRVIILDISGVYTQIHNQGYFEEEQLGDIKQQYSDSQHWRVVVIE